jgi:hypothetical protein
MESFVHAVSLTNGFLGTIYSMLLLWTSVILYRRFRLNFLILFIMVNSLGLINAIIYYYSLQNLFMPLSYLIVILFSIVITLLSIMAVIGAITYLKRSQK